MSTLTSDFWLSFDAATEECDAGAVDFGATCGGDFCLVALNKSSLSSPSSPNKAVAATADGTHKISHYKLPAFNEAGEITTSREQVIS